MANLPDSLDVKIDSLGLDKKVRAGELHYDNITILTDKDSIICGVKATRNSAAVAQE